MPPARRTALIRLAAFAAVVAGAVIVALATGSVPSAADVRSLGHDAGAVGPVVFVPLAIVLNCLFFPGPVLAGAAGALFGTGLGTVVALAGAVGAATAQTAITRHLARGGDLLPRRAHRFDKSLEQRGTLAVIYARILPAVPYVATNYAAGLTRLRLRSMALGTLIGAGPKTFAYTALGGSLGDLSEPEAKVAIALLVVFGVAGFVVAGWQWAVARGHRRPPAGAPVGDERTAP